VFWMYVRAPLYCLVLCRSMCAYLFVSADIQVRLIRDSRTKKSKGLCYIEFESRDSVPKAIALNGVHLAGFPISIAMTQAEKNIAARQAAQEPLVRLYVGGIHPAVSEEDLKPVRHAIRPGLLA